jgi:2-keto-4-pentenoate hydratase/2-oxohepta-3-ene-1,7-dioic acid hydratase in catechol pathway
MRIVRYKARGALRYGILYDDGVVKEIEGDVFEEFNETGDTFLLSEVTLLPPTVPTKIVAAGLNYKEHAKELGMKIPSEPLIFLKPKSSVIVSGENIVYPKMSNQVDYEGELGVVIRKKAKNIDKAEAKDYILGYICVNDITARDLQRKDIQFARSKSFDTFCPIGHCIQTKLDPLNVQIKTYVNGELRQCSSTSDMIFDAYCLVSFISEVMTLEAGDIISTGTPKGVGSINRGDEVVVEIENIGRLINKII